MEVEHHGVQLRLGGLQFDAKGIVHNQDNEFEPEYKREIRKYERAQLC